MSPEPKTTCVCSAFALCPECYRVYERASAQASLREFLLTFGTEQDPPAPLRYVPRFIRATWEPEQQRAYHDAFERFAGSRPFANPRPRRVR